MTDLRTRATRAAGAGLASTAEPAISDDGRTVAFTARDELGSADQRLGRRSGRAPSWCRVTDAGAAGGRLVLAPGDLGQRAPWSRFTSDAWNLAGAKCNAARGVFVRDRRAGTTRLLSSGDGGNRFRGPTRGSSAPGDMTVALICA